MANPFPRGSKEPTQSPSEVSARDASGWKKAAGNLDKIAGESTNDKPQLRGVEANTADGRASRTPTFQHEAQGTAEGDFDPAAPSDFDGYGGQGDSYSHAQGGVGGVR